MAVQIGDLSVRDDRHGSRYEVSVAGDPAGYAYYRIDGDRVIFTHTEVGQVWEGQGVGSALARGSLHDVRRTGRRVIPLCPFIANYIRRHREYLDLVDEHYRHLFDPPRLMSAVVFHQNLPVSDPRSLVDAQLPRPEARAHDLIVRVAAVSVNPVDVKRRVDSAAPPEGRILGFDASGTVVEIGEAVSLFAPGDEVYYAGSVDRPGSYAEFQAVDERIVGRKPSSLTHAQAAAIPLTAITAWESLFDRLQLGAESSGTLLVLGGAGGVGSMLIQLAKKLTGLTVIATASRPETRVWVLEHGADHVVDHFDDLASQVLHVAPDGVEYIFTSQTKDAVPVFEKVLKPFGHVVTIDDPAELDIRALKPKSIAWHWELMFTRALFHTPDMIEQHHLLNRITDLIDEGTIRGTLTTTLSPLTAANLREAHRMIESGRTIGKVVVSRQ